MQSPVIDVMVIGAGIVGLSAAIAIRQRGFSVMLIDAGSITVDVDSSTSRVYAINQASQNLFTSMDVWALIDKKYLSPYRHMHIWDAKQGAAIDFDARTIGSDRLGYILDEYVIKCALLEKASQLDIHRIPNFRVSKVELLTDAIQVGNNNESWVAKLLIIADGAMSTTRALLNIPLTTWTYHQKAIVASVRTKHAHHRTAYQVFHQTGPLAFLPLPDPHESSIVWSTSPTQVDQLMNLSDDEFGVKLGEAFAEKLGAVQVTSKRHQFDLHMRHVQRYIDSRWLLMGDAAHTIHPMAGLGLNIGLADLAAWLQILDSGDFVTRSARCLSRYQRQRKYALWQTIALMEGLHLLFTNTMPPVMALRGFGLTICNHLLPLKRLMIEHAAGKI